MGGIDRLWAIDTVRTAVVLADRWGCPLFQVIPQFLPYGAVSEIELALWAKFFDEKKSETRN